MMAKFHFDIYENPLNKKTLGHNHCHDLVEIYFITKGTCKYVIGNKVYHLEKGDVVIIPRGIIHRTEYDDTAYSRMLIFCPSEFIPASVVPIFSSTGYLYRNPEIFDEILDVFNKFDKERHCDKNYSEEILRCYVQLLFFILARNTNYYDEKESINTYIDKAMKYIQEKYMYKIALDEIAEECLLAPEYFSRLFKKETGFSYNEYLNIYRLTKAERLIRVTSKSISQIAEECGFESSGYFSTKFKKMYGISPRKLKNYRNM